MKLVKSTAAMFLSVMLSAVIPSAVNAEEQWELKKEEEGIQVYTRSVTDSQLKEFKGVASIEANTNLVISLLKDADNFTEWMPDTAESRLLKLNGDNQYHYILTNVPWPVSDRDGVYQFIYTNHNKGNISYVEVNVQSVPDFLPVTKGKVRIPKADGVWLIEPNGGQTKVTYQLHADPGGTLPNWLVNSSVVDTPFNLLKSMKTRLEDN